ncbi:HEAT repeat domain-containing protein [Myxococcaceae bacterium GXIMD 01537]
MTPASPAPGRAPRQSPSSRHSARWLAALAFMLVAGETSVASARMSEATPSSTEPLHSRVVTLLRDPDVLARAGDWTSLGPEALAILEQVPGDPHAPPEYRVRAVQSLAFVAHPEAPGRLRALLENSDLNPTLRAHAALALGLRAGPEALSALLPHLQDRHRLVRAAVALALGRLGGAEAQRALEERLPLEEELLVREAIQQGLTLVEP